MFGPHTRDSSDPALDRRVTWLLTAAAAPTEPGALPGEAEAVAAFRAITHVSRRSRMFALLTSAKAAAAGTLFAGVVLTGGVAAAATGSLPDTAQDTAREWLAKVGMTVPGADETADQGDAAAADSEGGAAREQAPDAADQGLDLSDLAQDSGLIGLDKGAAVSDTASDGQSRAGKAGGAGAEAGSARATDAGDAAVVDTPNGGGTGTADDASAAQGDASSTSGTGVADEDSGGRSASGSGNATRP